MQRCKDTCRQAGKDKYKLFGSEPLTDKGSPSTIENIIICKATTGTKWSS
jgi:hypothetical protein